MLELVSSQEIGSSLLLELEPVKKELEEWCTPCLAFCLVGRMFPPGSRNPVSAQGSEIRSAYFFMQLMLLFVFLHILP